MASVPGTALCLKSESSRAFRGTEKVGGVVSVRTGFGGGDSGYNFEIGARYLVDASKNEGTPSYEHLLPYCAY